MGLFKYIQDTRGEMKHVAWPTQKQTTVFTVLVIVVSILTALYLGLFDYVFTNSLQRVVDTIPGGTEPTEQLQVGTSTESTSESGFEFSATPVGEDGAPLDVEVNTEQTGEGQTQ